MQKAARLRFSTAVKDRFDQRKDYDAGNVLHPRFAKRIVEQTEIKKGWKVLDLACGTGLATFHAAELVGSSGRVLGVDFSPVMLQQAETKLTNRNSNVSFRMADMETVELEAKSFDAVLAASAVPYLTDVNSAFAKFHSWLIKPGGVLSYNCPEADYSPLIALVSHLLRDRGKSGWRAPMNCLPSIDAHKKMLSTAGFSEIKVVRTSQKDDGLQYNVEEYPEAAWKFIQGFDAFFQLDSILTKEEKEDLKIDFKNKASVLGCQLADCDGVIHDAFSYLWVSAKS